MTALNSLIILHKEGVELVADPPGPLRLVSECGLFDEPEGLLLLHSEGEDLRHGLQHLRLHRLGRGWVRVVDQELVDQPTVHHELEGLTIFLDLTDQFMCLPLYLQSFILALS